MMESMRVVMVSCALVAASGTAMGQTAPIGLGFGDGIELVTQHEITPGTNTFMIGGPAGGFFFDPGAGAWQKELIAPPDGFVPGQVYQIQEWVTFFAPPPGTLPLFPLEDWHEQIELDINGEIWDVWVDSPLTNISLEDGTASPPLPGLEFGISMDGTNIWFDFDPVFPSPNGTTLHITKEFRFIGQTVSFDPVIITQYPTPAPGAMGLVGIAGVAAARRRR